jgi:hypothetical protein
MLQQTFVEYISVWKVPSSTNKKLLLKENHEFYLKIQNEPRFFPGGNFLSVTYIKDPT